MVEAAILAVVREIWDARPEWRWFRKRGDSEGTRRLCGPGPLGYFVVCLTHGMYDARAAVVVVEAMALP
eukprot:9136118-Lingulodinium_polyedra.AAC.1